MNSLDILEGMKNKPYDCWEWDAQPNISGVCQVRYNGSMKPIARVSFMLHKGPITSNDIVWHLCSNIRCFNPQHLVKGTRSEYSKYCLSITSGLKSKGSELIPVNLNSYWYYRRKQYNLEDTDYILYLGKKMKYDRFVDVWRMNRDRLSLGKRQGIEIEEETYANGDSYAT